MAGVNETVERMIGLFPGVALKDLVVLVDANCDMRVTRGGVETVLIGMENVSEDDNGGLWLWEDDGEYY